MMLVPQRGLAEPPILVLVVPVLAPVVLSLSLSRAAAEWDNSDEGDDE